VNVVDPGHCYELAELDGGEVASLQFVKREGEMYPGNVGTCPGTTTQEVLRALIDRTLYVNGQDPCVTNYVVLEHLRRALWELEDRAAKRRGARVPEYLAAVIENEPTCSLCGHVPAAHNGACR